MLVSCNFTVFVRARVRYYMYLIVAPLSDEHYGDCWDLSLGLETSLDSMFLLIRYDTIEEFNVESKAEYTA